MHIVRLRKITVYFLIAEILDIITMFLVLKNGGRELNPLIGLGVKWFVLIKLLIVLLVAIALQILQAIIPHKVYIVVPWVATLFPLWNSIQLLLVRLLPLTK